MSMSTLSLLEYYSSLLIKQYANKPKAIATIQALVRGVIMAQTSTQQITFSSVPDSGSYTLSYDGETTGTIPFGAMDSDVQTALQALDGLSAVTVLNMLVSFTGVVAPALSLVVETNTLETGGIPVSIMITETDLTLPLAVQNGYNLLGDNPAVGLQLDVLGKYANVTRNGNSTSGQPITLNDSDFLTLIRVAIISNNSGSSLYEINNLLFQFFGTTILCVDNANMTLDYLISSLSSTDLIELFITENVLPHPMGVQISVIIYAPIVNAFFGFVTYDNPIQPMVTRPFNDYDDYQTDWPWFSYSDVLII